MTTLTGSGTAARSVSPSGSGRSRSLGHHIHSGLRILFPVHALSALVEWERNPYMKVVMGC